MREPNKLASMIVAVVFLCSSLATAAETDAKIKTTMQQAFESLSALVDGAFVQEFDLKKDDAFKAALEAMRGLSDEIDEHAALNGDSLSLVSSSLAKSIDQMIANYQAGYEPIAEAFLVDSVDLCVACHSQSPDLQSDINTDDFTETIVHEGVDISLAARMLIAVRKFSDAVMLWETHLLNKNFTLQSVDSEEIMLEYISRIIHLDVGSDKMFSILDELKDRADTPYYFKRKIRIWMDQLRLLDTYDVSTLSIDDIEKMANDCVVIEQKSVRKKYPVCDILVSGLSARMLRQLPEDQNVFEAKLYVNMGVARFNTAVPVESLPLIERYLEAAIVTAPDSEVSRTAYAYLEELAYHLYNDLFVAEEIMDISFDELKKLTGIN